MKNEVKPDSKVTLLPAENIPPAIVGAVRKVLIKHINGVRVVLQETEMAFSMN